MKWQMISVSIAGWLQLGQEHIQVDKVIYL